MVQPHGYTDPDPDVDVHSMEMDVDPYTTKSGLLHSAPTSDRFWPNACDIGQELNRTWVGYLKKPLHPGQTCQ